MWVSEDSPARGTLQNEQGMPRMETLLHNSPQVLAFLIASPISPPLPASAANRAAFSLVHPEGVHAGLSTPSAFPAGSGQVPLSLCLA